MKYFILIVMLLLTIPLAYAHHKDDHEQGQGQNQGGGQSGNNPPDHANNDKDKDKKPITTSSGCSRTYITNNASTYARCTIIDTESPMVIDTIRTKSMMCIKVTDNVGISKIYGIYISGVGDNISDAVEFNFHNGSYSWYCAYTIQDFVYILAEDIAGNRGIIV